MKKKWTYDSILKEALKYTTRGQFDRLSPSAYNAARRLGIVNDVCGHMKTPQKIWTLEEMKIEALKYQTRQEFNKNSPIYAAAYKKGFLDDICSHMNWTLKPWTEEEIKTEALKYNTRQEFNKNSTAYRAAQKRGILDKICSHMHPPLKIWSIDELIKISKLYNARSEFYKNENAAYQAARKRKILDSICSHMKRSATSSSQEKHLFNEIKELFPKAQKLVDRKVNILNKPHIKGFDIDVYIPELRKGIEFDGDYWHGVYGLKRSREHWPLEDLENYHQIKDEYFRSKGIELLHINEKEWLEDRENSIAKCKEFLGF